MNIRSLTRGDGVVIGAAVLLFISSFLDIYSSDGLPNGYDMPSLWSSGPVLMGVVLAGLVAAALVVASRALPQPSKIAGLEVGQFGVAFAVFAAWSALGNIFDPAGAVNNVGGGTSDGPSAGAGLILALVATLILAGAAVATPLVPALQGALIPAPKPVTPQPYGAQPPAGYGYPGAQQSSFGGQPPQQGQQPGQPAFGGQQGPAQPPAADFSPFWFAVPVPRPLFAEDGAPTPIAELAPGTWYLAVEQGAQGLIAQTQDGRRGVLRDTSGIQRG
ncbi:DUF5336 domain-containing protein [Streptomyces sp. NPDC102395]|uniref:DUF5336 domain-containing protein n=1 Tax=Streptomyces sp. NPDC102395 TaxID=3366168 RepID=UPI00381ABADC